MEELIKFIKSNGLLNSQKGLLPFTSKSSSSSSSSASSSKSAVAQTPSVSETPNYFGTALKVGSSAGGMFRPATAMKSRMGLEMPDPQQTAATPAVHATKNRSDGGNKALAGIVTTSSSSSSAFPGLSASINSGFEKIRGSHFPSLAAFGPGTDAVPSIMSKPKSRMRADDPAVMSSTASDFGTLQSHPLKDTSQSNSTKHTESVSTLPSAETKKMDSLSQVRPSLRIDTNIDGLQRFSSASTSATPSSRGSTASADLRSVQPLSAGVASTSSSSRPTSALSVPSGDALDEDGLNIDSSTGKRNRGKNVSKKQDGRFRSQSRAENEQDSGSALSSSSNTPTAAAVQSAAVLTRSKRSTATATVIATAKSPIAAEHDKRTTGRKTRASTMDSISFSVSIASSESHVSIGEPVPKVLTKTLPVVTISDDGIYESPRPDDIRSSSGLENTVAGPDDNFASISEAGLAGRLSRVNSLSSEGGFSSAYSSSVFTNMSSTNNTPLFAALTVSGPPPPSNIRARSVDIAYGANSPSVSFKDPHSSSRSNSTKSDWPANRSMRSRSTSSATSACSSTLAGISIASDSRHVVVSFIFVSKLLICVFVIVVSPLHKAAARVVVSLP
jgi:hypothetical protein